MMQPISRPKLSDLVSEAIVRLITDQALKPGDKLPTEKELSQRLGIGKTSVREGIRNLEALGLLSSHQGDGVYLREVTLDSVFKIDPKIPMASFLRLSKQEILDLVSTRFVIESEACRIAADRITGEEIKSLKVLYDGMAGSLDSPEKFISWDMQFHKQIMVASGNIILTRIFGLIEDLYSKQQSVVATLPGAMERALEFHESILSALAQKKAKRAVQVMRQHLENMREVLSRSL